MPRTLIRALAAAALLPGLAVPTTATSAAAPAASAIRTPYVTAWAPVANATSGAVTRYVDNGGRPVVAYARPAYNTPTAGFWLAHGTKVTGPVRNGWMHLADGRWLPLTSTVSNPSTGRAVPTSTQAWATVPGFDVEASRLNAYVADLAYIGKVNGNRATGTVGFQKGIDYVAAKLRAAGYVPQVQTFTTKAGKRSVNLVAELPGTSSDVVVMGAHVDSVRVSPGGNDNGTGVATVLRMAELYKASNLTHRQTVRFAFWGAEESGFEGSSAYTASLGAAGRARIKAYFNVDMIASPNGGYFTYGASFAASQLDAIYAARIKIRSQRQPDTRLSDHQSFAKWGIGIQYVGPKGNWFANPTKTTTQAVTYGWGGQAGQPFDRCYHQSCDGIGNVNTTALNRVADAASVWLFRWAGYTG